MNLQCSCNTVLKKNPQPTMNYKKILLRGDLEITQPRARASFKNKFTDTSFFCISQSLLSSHQKLVFMLQWCQAGDAAKWREAGLRQANSNPFVTFCSKLLFPRSVRQVI